MRTYFVQFSHGEVHRFDGPGVLHVLPLAVQWARDNVLFPVGPVRVFWSRDYAGEWVIDLGVSVDCRPLLRNSLVQHVG